MNKLKNTDRKCASAGVMILKASEAHVTGMDKEKFAALEAEDGSTLRAVSVNISKGFDSAEAQEQVAKWRQW